MTYAAAAFGLFAIQTVVEYLEDSMGVGLPHADVLAPAFTFAVLALFFWRF